MRNFFRFKRNFEFFLIFILRNVLVFSFYVLERKAVRNVRMSVWLVLSTAIYHFWIWHINMINHACYMCLGTGSTIASKWTTAAAAVTARYLLKSNRSCLLTTSASTPTSHNIYENTVTLDMEGAVSILAHSKNSVLTCLSIILLPYLRLILLWKWDMPPIWFGKVELRCTWIANEKCQVGHRVRYK
jgi:hypothetical protein